LKYSDLSSTSISVTLKPAFSFVVEFPGNYYSFEASGESGGTLQVDWGDGTAIESLPLGFMNHDYPNDGNYIITVTGDLDRITKFGASYQLIYVDLYRLTELKDLLIGVSRVKEVDMRKNTKLEKLWLETFPGLENFILPEESYLRDIQLVLMPRVTTPVIDKAITTIYNNTKRLGITGGRLHYYNYGYGLPISAIGPPSADAIAMLTELRDEYGWSLRPSL
jgi:hypothetical protein